MYCASVCVYAVLIHIQSSSLSVSLSLTHTHNCLLAFLRLFVDIYKYLFIIYIYTHDCVGRAHKKPHTRMLRKKRTHTYGERTLTYTRVFPLIDIYTYYANVRP